jgi:hypothetical protein
MLKNAASGGRMKWPFTCVATTGTEILSFNVEDLQRAAHNIDRAVNDEMDRIMMAVAAAPPIAAAMGKSAKLCAELRACAERSHVVWLGRSSAAAAEARAKFQQCHCAASLETAAPPHAAHRNSRVLERGQLLDGVFLLLQGELSVHVAQKVRVARQSARALMCCSQAIISTTHHAQRPAAKEMSQVSLHIHARVCVALLRCNTWGCAHRMSVTAHIAFAAR